MNKRNRYFLLLAAITVFLMKFLLTPVPGVEKIGDPKRVKGNKEKAAAEPYALIENFVSSRAGQDIERKKLSLSMCIEHALEHHPSMKRLRLELEKGKSEVEEAGSVFLPSVRAETSLRNSKGEINNKDFSNSSASTSLSMEYLLWNGGKKEKRLTNSRLSLESLKESYRKARNEKIMEVVNCYHSLLKAIRSHELASKTLSQSEMHLAFAKANYEAGVVPRVDVVKAEAEVASRKLELLRAWNQLKLAEANLCEAVGFEKTFRVEPAGPLLSDDSVLSGEIERALDENTRDSLVARALQERIDLKIQRLSIAMKKIALGLARTNYTASLTVLAGLSGSGDDYGSLSNNRSSTAGIAFSFSLPLFDGGASRSLVRRAEAELKASELRLVEMERKAALEVERACLSLQEARAGLEAAKKTLEYSEEALRLSEGRYRNGMCAFTELVDARVFYENAAKAVIEQTNNFELAKFVLVDSMGLMERVTGPCHEKNS